MKLIQAKLRGTGPLIESNWFQLSTHLNQFHFSHPTQGTTFLRALQSLHPPFSCKEKHLFGDLPHYEKRGSHTRHIQAAKRTITLGVFGTTAELVTELGLLDQNLYETDRIEIGRRLDYSRWLNFVEISSSTRWKEIEADVLELIHPMERIHSQIYTEATSFIDGLKGSSRVKDEVAERLLYFLQDLENQQQNNALLRKTVDLIKRASHFQAARRLVFQRLPLLIYFNGQGNIAAPLIGHQSSSSKEPELLHYIKQKAAHLAPKTTAFVCYSKPVLEKLQAGIDLSILVSKETRRLEPIFLFDAPETNISAKEHTTLRQLIQETAQSYQCLYLSRSKNFFPPSETGRNYTCRDLALEKD